MNTRIRLLTFIFALISTNAAFGQVTLSGASYTQSFDSIGDTLPTGWSVTTSATLSSLGDAAAFTSSANTWNATSGTFRNISSNNIALTSDATAQSNNANRALGWRPLSSTAAVDRIGALTFKLDNTLGFRGIAVSIDLFQAFNTSDVQTYKFEYRIGDSGNFTQIGSNYVTKDKTADFTDFNALQISSISLTGIDDQSSAVYFRIRGVSTAGTTNLDTIGIDNFSLTYAAIPESSTYAMIAGLAILGLTALADVELLDSNCP